MTAEISLMLLYITVLAVVGFLLYTLLNKPKPIQIYKEQAPIKEINTHWWGYGWRPWWRRYGGVPGFRHSHKNIA
jgi:hypothetical protein